MSAITISAKAAPILPARWQDDRPLFFVLVILVYLACLSAMAAHNSYRAANQWGADLRGKATIQIMTEQISNSQSRNGKDVIGSGQSGPDNAAALQGRIIDLAREQPGIKDAAAISEQDAKALLRPWLGDVTLPDSLPVPILVELTVTDPRGLEPLSAAIKAEGIEVQIDDHQRWGADIDRAAKALQIIATLALFLLVGATSAAAAFATQSGMSARASIINVLEQVGAAPRYIARLFILRFARLGAFAGAAGAGLALITALLFWLMSGTSFIPNFALGRLGIGVLILAPLLAGAICALTAGYCALHSLSRHDYEIGAPQ